MNAGDDARQPSAVLSGLRREAVTKDDGRYLIYYGWPSDERAAEARSGTEPAPADRRPEPPLEPWTSQAEPPDV